MTQKDFTDFKRLSAKLIVNKNKLDSGKRMSWMQCRWFQFNKGSSTVKVKMALDGSTFDCLHTGTTDSDAVLLDDGETKKTMK